MSKKQGRAAYNDGESVDGTVHEHREEDGAGRDVAFHLHLLACDRPCLPSLADDLDDDYDEDYYDEEEDSYGDAGELVERKEERGLRFCATASSSRPVLLVSFLQSN